MAKELLRRTVIDNPYIPKMAGMFPSVPQAYFLTAPVDEILYGGAAGGGKSAGILAAALQYVTCPGYDAIILRRSFSDLEKPGALIDLSQEWLANTDAEYDGQAHRWHFPSGASLSFGHLQNRKSTVQDYQGSAYSFIGFDELTQFEEFMYRYLFSRRRKRVGLPFPIRTRATSNPGGEGHVWVKQRFIVEEDNPSRMFIPARLEDNPGLDREEYGKSLDELDLVTRRQLKHGDWDVVPEGNMFKREWFKTVPADRVPSFRRVVRQWDLAATTAEEGADPDWLVGCKIGQAHNGNYYVSHVHRDRVTPEGVEAAIRQFAASDGRNCMIRIEQEGAASGKIVKYNYERMLDGYDARFDAIPKSSKMVRANPFSAACERRQVYLVEGPWIQNWLDEVCAFGGDVAHDDQVDAASGAYHTLTTVINVSMTEEQPSAIE